MEDSQSKSRELLERAEQLRLGFTDEEYALYKKWGEEYGGWVELTEEEFEEQMRQADGARGHKWFR